MYVCELCNYTTSSNNSINRHNKTKKHIKLLNIDVNKKTIKICNYCNKEFTFINNFYRHRKTCKLYNTEENTTIIDKCKILEDEINKLKKEHEYKLEIEKLKNELTKKDLEISKKEIEKKNLQLQINTNSNNTTIINNINISKIEYLNTNFSNVIDMETFIENYRNKYGLNEDQTRTLLENSQNDGINGCISSLFYYLKKSAMQQYKDMNGQDIEMHNIILPFILSDKYIRDHYEKSISGKWDKTTMIDNLKRIVSITNDQIYKHHNQFMGFNGPQRKRIINGILKASGFSNLDNITIKDFYKNQIEN
jgi:hypothetical protein